MEVGADIARIVLQSRNSYTSRQDGGNIAVESAVKEAEHILSMEVPVRIKTLLVHEECLRAGIQCSCPMLIEVWTFQLHRDGHNDQLAKALEPFFLKNAVRSHLHFSQFNSWMTNNNGRLPNGLVFAYRLAYDSITGATCKTTVDEESGEYLEESHIFPTAKFGLSSLLTVTVNWKKFLAPPILPTCSLFENSRFSIDDWLLPPDSVSPNSSCGSFMDSSSSSAIDDKCPSNSFVIEDEESSGIYSAASTSSNEPSLSRFGSGQSINEPPSEEKNSDPQQQLFVRKTRPHDLGIQFDSPPKKRNFLDESTVGCISLNSPTMRLLDQLDQYATASKVAKSAEVENLADSLAKSSSLTNTERTAKPTVASRRQSVPRRCRLLSAFRFMSGTSTIFSKKTGLPLNSSPAPFNRNELKVKSPPLASSSNGEDDSGASDNERLCSTKSAPTSNGLLCNFEESILNGRLEPRASLEGFRLQLTASGPFCSPHISFPVETFFFDLSEDNAPSPYFGRCSLERLGRKGYQIPKKGVVQATLFNPQGTVVCLFVVRFDVSEMPSSSQTFLRQRQFFMPPDCPFDEINRSWLRYLIHIRLATDRQSRLYVHSDIRMLFSQKSDLDGLNVELEESEGRFELRAFTEMPQKPRFSPRK